MSLLGFAPLGSLPLSDDGVQVLLNGGGIASGEAFGVPLIIRPAYSGAGRVGRIINNPSPVLWSPIVFEQTLIARGIPSEERFGKARLRIKPYVPQFSLDLLPPIGIRDQTVCSLDSGIQANVESAAPLLLDDVSALTVDDFERIEVEHG